MKVPPSYAHQAIGNTETSASRQDDLCRACTRKRYKGGLPCPDPACRKGVHERVFEHGGRRYVRAKRDGRLAWVPLDA